MAYSYRKGAAITYMREDGGPGPGETVTYSASDGWQVEIQDQGCVEVTGYLKNPVPPSLIIPWHRIWQISSI